MINRKLQGKLKERGYTQQRLAKEIGISESTFSRKVRNNSFGIQEAEQIAQILRVNPAEIFFNL